MRIELENLIKRFGQTPAIDRLCLSIETGERVALIGPNGSGKTTLLRVLMGMLGAEGAVLVGSSSPFTQREQLARNVAYVPQIAPQFGVPVGQLIQTICRIREIDKDRVHGLSETLGFRPAEHETKPFRDLSGGMKQKLLIALALATEPDLLIMDEPTASLDADARRHFFELCGELSESTTLVLCSHRVEEVRHLVGRVVALEGGRLVADGPVEQFVASLGRAVIELRVSEPSGELATWLAERGFRKLSGNRYTVFVEWQTKLDAVRELMTRWGGEIEDLIVNDLHELQIVHGNGSPASEKEHS
ncbi:MAG: ABC transporter ATP-binding protein [Chrysiogenetes bacterium]|nr:ABC transporter ATP-binding protein [Chrysiogenetes bacterium]